MTPPSPQNEPNKKPSVLDTVFGGAPVNKEAANLATPSNEPSELDKAIESFEISVTDQPNNRRIILSAAKRTKELEQRVKELEECLEPGKASAIVNGIFKEAERLGFYKPTHKHALTQFVEQVEMLHEENDSLKATLRECAEILEDLYGSEGPLPKIHKDYFPRMDKALSNPIVAAMRKDA